MPSNRRLKTAAFIAVLTVLVIFYVSNGASQTYSSPFYTRTVAAIQNRHDAEARDAMLADEKARLERVQRIEKEHDKAMEHKISTSGEVGKEAAKGEQKPFVEDVKDAGEKVAEGAKVAQEAITGEQGKPVAGRKMMKDGKVVVNEKNDGNDGVAKVGNTGNTGAKAESAAKKEEGPESEEEHQVEVEMNSILKKGPIIVFSKSYCPFSKKAKVRLILDPLHEYMLTMLQHVLLDLYTITPPPYVVELDQYPLGPGLQAALLKSTGRKTVPNVLINGKSIGGGDDVTDLHEEGKLAEKIKSMGGKRVMEVKPVEKSEKREMRFRG